ncbi:MAG: acyl-CoA dehydrogenase family protein [Acidimicrobiales bacterium]
MSDARDQLVDSATALMRDLCTPADVREAERTGWSPALWSALRDAGFPLVGVGESDGGSGGDLVDACALLEVAGTFGAPVPLAETGMLGGWALAAAGLPLPDGPITVAPGVAGDTVALEGGPGGWKLRCRVQRVAWAAASDVVVLLAPLGDGYAVVALPQGSFQIEPGHNLAGEPRDVVTADPTLPDGTVAAAPPGVDPSALALRGALSRAALMAGAMQRVAALTQRYTGERQQFGRPIARFQAIQRHLVRIAEQAHATRTAVHAAAANASASGTSASGVTVTSVAAASAASSVRGLDLFDVAAAKIVAGDAATAITAASHQAHGAMGMTREYELPLHTRRLWSWRDEYGNEAHWSGVLGRHLAAAGADALWPRIATGRVA